ncbi:MAG: SMC-Scp complex subunit ScpB [Patescibacteria group bacterium]|nr:SMC-Scp complex subunit ScpB [Patescibacteria group bacterium]
MPSDKQDLKNSLEAILFVSNKPLKPKDFAAILGADETEIIAALNELAEERKSRGLVLLENGGEYQLATNSKYSTAVKNFLNAELREKLTDATVEVLAIIAYRQPISKAEIEAIRGVNSQYSIRNLLMRGLVEKVPNPGDARSVLYQTTTEFLMHLGITSVTDLPEFQTLVEKIKLPQTAPLAMEAAAQQTPNTDEGNKMESQKEINQPGPDHAASKERAGDTGISQDPVRMSPEQIDYEINTESKIEKENLPESAVKAEEIASTDLPPAEPGPAEIENAEEDEFADEDENEESDED